jgi:hypothetical protein
MNKLDCKTCVRCLSGQSAAQLEAPARPDEIWSFVYAKNAPATAGDVWTWTAFPKKVENHAAAIALHTMYYNFVRIHQTLKVTPAMAAGVTDKLWEVSDIVAMLEQWELANFKPEYQFVVRQYAIGKGHSVSVMWRGGEVDTIFGFEREADALQWIKEKSQAWLIEHK